MNIKILMPVLRILFVFPVILIMFSIPVYADPFIGSLSLSPSSVAVGYSGTYSASMEPTSIPPGGFFVTNAIIPAGYEFIQPAPGNLIASYTMYNKVMAKNQVIINIFSNNPATNTVDVQYSLNNGVSYITAGNLDRANMVIGATTLKFTPPTTTVAGSIEITLGGTAGPVTTDHVVSIVLGGGVLRSPVTPGSYIWNLEAKNSPGGTSYIKSAIATVYSITSLIRNPGFESGTTDWNNYGVSFTSGAPASEGIKSANIGISTVGSNMQLYQYGITLEPNTKYRLTFSAFSNTGHDMSVKLFKHGSPYTNYGLDPDYNLTTAWHEFSTEFTTTGFSSTVNDARLMFWFVPFAAPGDRYYIDSVRLVKVVDETGILSISTTPVGGQIYVDGVLKGTGSWNGSVSVGGHIVSFGPFEGYSTPSPQAVTVTAGGTSSITGTYILIANILSNPGFESGTASWNNWGITFTAAPPASEGINSANIVTQGGSNMQLYQYGITLEPYTSHRLTFSAYSNTGHDMTANLFKHGSPYTGYGLNQRYDLTTGWKEFSTEFTTTGFSSTVNDARFMFQLGSFAAAGEKYYIDNVRLVNIGIIDTGILSVATTPVNGQIYVDGVLKGTGSWNGSISVGTHTVSFGPLTGYSTPVPQAVTIAAGGTSSVTGVYIIEPTGTLSIATTPISGQIYVDGLLKGTGSWTGLVSVGTHTVSFGPFTGYSTPSPQAVTVTLGGTSLAIGTYIANILSNPGFESGTASWNNWGITFTAAPPASEGINSANIVTQGGSNMQLYQYGITLEPYTGYRLTFAAYSNTGHDMTANLLKHGSPYTGYGLNQRYNLTTGWKEFSTVFTTTGFSSTVNDARLMFQLGSFAAAGEKYYIDNVRLEKI